MPPAAPTEGGAVQMVQKVARAPGSHPRRDNRSHESLRTRRVFEVHPSHGRSVPRPNDYGKAPGQSRPFQSCGVHISRDHGAHGAGWRYHRSPRDRRREVARTLAALTTRAGQRGSYPLYARLRGGAGVRGTRRRPGDGRPCPVRRRVDRPPAEWVSWSAADRVGVSGLARAPG